MFVKKMSSAALVAVFGLALPVMVLPVSVAPSTAFHHARVRLLGQSGRRPKSGSSARQRHPVQPAHAAK